MAKARGQMLGPIDEDEALSDPIDPSRLGVNDREPAPLATVPATREPEPAAAAEPIIGTVITTGADQAYYEELPPEGASEEEQLAWFEGRLYDAKSTMMTGLKAITDAFAQQARVSLWELKERELWRKQLDPDTKQPFPTFVAYAEKVHELKQATLYRIVNQQTVLLALGPGVGDAANKDTLAAAYGVWKAAYRPERDKDAADATLRKVWQMALEAGAVTAKTLRAASERLGVMVTAADEERPELPARPGPVQRATKAAHALDQDTLLAVRKEDPVAAEELRVRLRAALMALGD
jgi:hypothetical protein